MVKIDRDLCETKYRDPCREQQCNTEFLGHTQGVFPVEKLMGEKVGENRSEQEQSGF